MNKKRKLKKFPKRTEELARAIISNYLHIPVEHHDDGSQPSMYDLRVGSVENPVMAIECVRAVDAQATEAWNMGPAKGPFEWGQFLKGDWIVWIKRYARIKPLENNLPSLLNKLESSNIYDVSVDATLESKDKNFYDLLVELGVLECSCYRVQGSGQVKLQTEVYKSELDRKGLDISKWLSQFLSHDKQKDILLKLKKSNARHKHVFIMVSLEGATTFIDTYLTHKIEVLPTESPTLPEPIDAVWVMHHFGKEENHEGIFWNGNTWHVFTIPQTQENTP